MGWFNHLRIRSKLLVAFTLLVALLVGQAYLSYWLLAEKEQVERQGVDTANRALAGVYRLASDINHLRGQILVHIAYKDGAARGHAEQEIDKHWVEIDRDVATVREYVQSHLPAARSRVAILERDIVAYREAGRRQLELVASGKDDDALALAAGAQLDTYHRIGDGMHEIGEKIEADTAAAVDRARDLFATSLRMSIGFAVVAVLLASLLVRMLDRELAGPIARVAKVAKRLAVGDLSVEMQPGNRRDEVGYLERAFCTLIDRLKESAAIAERVAAGDLTVQIATRPSSDNGDVIQRSLRTMIDSLRGMNIEMRDGFGVLASSSSEILATVSQVAAGASQTATAVGETSNTVEEVKFTAHLSVEKAQAVQDTALKTAAVSQTGRQAVTAMIEGMGRIREQMESITDSVMRLSEQSQTIAEIIATVNDLSEQSNLLAVNAAIEATRAGEFGKGFGIVAQEVKSLAEQSREATRQVRTILMEVQKATSAAVLATEQGAKAVAAGVKQAGEASETIEVLSGSVSEAARTATQIAASSQQQLAGMDLIAQAIVNIKQAAMQNMAGTKQLEASALSLQDLGGRLKVLVERHRIEA